MNLMIKQGSKLPVLFLIVFVVLFIISRLGYLNLPLYWDEAWSYGTSVFELARNPAFLPDVGNPDLTRGHPPVFYFISACWVKLTGTDTTRVHLLPLIVSVTLLGVIFIVSRVLFDTATALAAVVLFALQSLFLAQSTLLLPEIILTLWTVLTVFTYFTKKWGLFLLFSVLLVMTKETGIILTGALFIDKIILEPHFREKQAKPPLRLQKEILIMTVPVLVFAAFMITQKVRHGWFLYPEHTQLMTTGLYDIPDKWIKILSRLCFLHGRNILFIVSIAALVYLLIKKSCGKPQLHYLLFSGVFIFFFTTFSSVNFFSERYLLCVLPFFIIPCSWLITNWVKNNWLKVFPVTSFALLFAFYTFKGNLNEQDTSLGFRNTVLLQQRAVNYAEEMKWQQKNIYATFLMQYYLSIPEMGYLNNPLHPFTVIRNNRENSYDIYIFCSNEQDPFHSVIQNDSHFPLIKRFENKGAWVEIFGKSTR